jgi:hypothetical protein
MKLCNVFNLLYLRVYLLYLLYLQPNFNPSEVPFRTMRTMGDRIMKQMLPEEHIHKVDLHEGIEL